VVIDADAILARGDHPLGAVRAALKDLAPGDILRIDAGFRPVPLLDALAKEGFATAVESSGGRVRSFVGLTPPGRRSGRAGPTAPSAGA
jgi:hypothetical protein